MPDDLATQLAQLPATPGCYLFRDAEGQLLGRALREAGGDLPRAADRLGLTTRALAQRLRDHGIPLEDEGWPIPKKAP